MKKHGLIIIYKENSAVMVVGRDNSLEWLNMLDGEPLKKEETFKYLGAD